jgi:hypothetical protein
LSTANLSRSHVVFDPGDLTLFATDSFQTQRKLERVSEKPFWDPKCGLVPQEDPQYQRPIVRRARDRKLVQGSIDIYAQAAREETISISLSLVTVTHMCDQLIITIFGHGAEIGPKHLGQILNPFFTTDADVIGAEFLISCSLSGVHGGDHGPSPTREAAQLVTPYCS